MTWDNPPDKVFIAGFHMYSAELRASIYTLLQVFAPRIEAWMKANASWTDRTGNARQGLWAEAEKLTLGAVLVMDHGMEYGEYLEYSYQGAYAIIEPAMAHWQPLIWAALMRIMR